MSKLKLGLLFLVLLTTSGCYYAQAVRGHLDLMARREPVSEIIDEEGRDPELRRRLRLVQAARDFSISELGLPDNDSYRSYADLERDQVLWNIFAAPEFSLEPETWCYPFIGCLAYRGYFDEQKAQQFARSLSADGLDVAVGGVAAYSTLGRFDDPVLNTMMAWDDARLVGLIFHELAHQVVYIKDDTAFNESFATAVEEIGLERWLIRRGEVDALEHYRTRKAVEHELLALVSDARDDLERIYASGAGADRRAAKALRFEQLRDEVQRALTAAGLPERHWLLGELNNARLLPFALYEGYVPAFRGLFEACGERFDCFYAAVKELGRQAPAERKAELVRLASYRN